MTLMKVGQNGVEMLQGCDGLQQSPPNIAKY